MRIRMMTLSDIRNEFPILDTKINNHPIAYLDNAATAQKPNCVLKKIDHFYRNENANVHRGIHFLSQKSTEAFEGVRTKICKLLGTQKTQEIIYTRGATESINLVASSWGRNQIKAGDDIIVTRMEHHSNFVPWQALAKEKGANFKIVELTPEGEIDMHSLEDCLSGNPKILAVTMMSNTLGTINSIAEITRRAKEKGAHVLVDGAQGMIHLNTKISDLGDIDFLAFSSHKMCGPTGVGILWAREEILEKMPPYQFGGDMILSVNDQKSEWNDLPWKFEAGTPNIAGVIGFGEAIDFLEKLGRSEIQKLEEELILYAFEKFKAVDGITLLGPKNPYHRGSVFSFTVKGVHPHDLSTFLDTEGIAIRAGHHCTQPLMQKLGITATSRASTLFYNTKEELDRLFQSIENARKYFT